MPISRPLGVGRLRMKNRLDAIIARIDGRRAPLDLRQEHAERAVSGVVFRRGKTRPVGNGLVRRLRKVMARTVIVRRRQAAGAAAIGARNQCVQPVTKHAQSAVARQGGDGEPAMRGYSNAASDHEQLQNAKGAQQRIPPW